MQRIRIPARPAAGALAVLVAAGMVLAAPATVAAHAPSVVQPGNESPATAHELDDPGLSRAIGATLGAPGETDWYRMDLRAGDPLVVEVTAPDATGGIATSFTLLGPGLPAPASSAAVELAAAAGAKGAVEHRAAGGAREVHGGLGFIAWGGIRSTAPAAGTYWIAVRAADEGATGKYVLAPGVREEFGLETIGGMADLIAFFNDPWPPGAGASEAGSAPEDGGAPPAADEGSGARIVATIGGGIAAALLLVVVGSRALRRRAGAPGA